MNLYHYKARFYSPAIGRFLQTDPIGYQDDLNLYAYVGNDPLNLRDPTGLAREKFGGVGDFAVGFTPAGIYADIYGAATGKTLIGGQDLSGWERGLGLIPGFSEIAGVVRGVNRIDNAIDGAETFYRTMSQAHYDQLTATGKLPSTAETFISPTKAFSANYDGVLVEFTMQPGTTQALRDIGVRDASALTSQLYGDLPTVSKGWTSSNAFFKGEGTQVNIGLGRGTGLSTFNDNILNFQAVTPR